MTPTSIHNRMPPRLLKLSESISPSFYNTHVSKFKCFGGERCGSKGIMSPHRI